MQKRTYIFSLLFLSLCGAVIAQEEDNIGTETVTVVKPYSPTVSDAFKIKSSPSLNDSIMLQKKKINYSIFSVPVASTFTPAKGKASGVEKHHRPLCTIRMHPLVWVITTTLWSIFIRVANLIEVKICWILALPTTHPVVIWILHPWKRISTIPN